MTNHVQLPRKSFYENLVPLYTHLIFLQNNFCGNAAYSQPNKLKKQEEKKQTKGGENEKLIILPLVPFQTLEAVI